MKCTIKIDMDNAAFEDSHGQELARILRGLADSTAMHFHYKGQEEIKLRDINGNLIGIFRIIK